VLSLRFAHSFGLIHGNLNSKNISFDVDHRIQITDLDRIGQEAGAREKNSDGFSMDTDVRGFALILVEMVVGHLVMVSEAVTNQTIIGQDIPMFVSELIAARQSRESGIRQLFNDTLRF
jgi:hypothetical protein